MYSINLSSSFVIFIGGVLVLWAFSFVYMVYINCGASQRGMVPFDHKRRSKYNAVKAVDSEFIEDEVEDSEAPMIQHHSQWIMCQSINSWCSKSAACIWLLNSLSRIPFILFSVHVHNEPYYYYHFCFIFFCSFIIILFPFICLFLFHFVFMFLTQNMLLFYILHSFICFVV